MPGPFALNHVTTPYADFEELAAIACGLGIAAVEIRNDLDGVPLSDGTPAAALKALAEAAGIAILSINALQNFDRCTPARADAAAKLAREARQAGAQFLVLCPCNDLADPRTATQRASDLRAALTTLAPILAEHGIVGLLEPLGFAESALRRKQDAIDAIDDTATDSQFALLHDSFHHAISGETAIFPTRTGLVHISGVEDTQVPLTEMRDAHRVLVGPDDRLDTLGQIRSLRQGGYAGPLSFEAFSAQVHDDPNRNAALHRSIAYLSS